MSAQETEQTIRDYLDALLHGGDFGAFFADDVVWTTMETGQEIRGREAVKHFIVALHSAWCGAAPELRNVTAADSVAAIEAIFAGTHTAEFAGIAATGAAVRLPYAVSYDLTGRKIAALRAYFPILALIQQLKDAAADAG